MRVVRAALHSAGLEPVRLRLLGEQVPLGDLDLLILGVAGDADDLHAVHQRPRHPERCSPWSRTSRPRGRSPPPGSGRRRSSSAPGSSTSSSAEDGSPRQSAPSLSISSSRNSGFAGLGLLHALHDLAGHGADVGPTMAAHLGLVAHAAQRHADEVAPGRPGDRSCRARSCRRRAGRPGRGWGRGSSGERDCTARYSMIRSLTLSSP